MLVSVFSDLSFKKGDIVYLQKQVDENWYHGELNGQHGFFPATYVQVLNVPSYLNICRFFCQFCVCLPLWEFNGQYGFSPATYVQVLNVPSYLFPQIKYSGFVDFLSVSVYVCLLWKCNKEPGFIKIFMVQVVLRGGGMVEPLHSNNVWLETLCYSRLLLLSLHRLLHHCLVLYHNARVCTTSTQEKKMTV